MRSRSSSPTLTTASTRRLVSRKYSASASRWAGLSPARYSGRPSDNASLAARSASSSSPSPLSSLDRRSTSASRFSTVSRSARANSSSTMRRCSSGSLGPVTSSSSNARSTSTMASTSRMLARKRLPRPSPFDAPSTRPPMSTTSIAACTMLRRLRHLRQPVEPRVGDLGDADVGVLRGERVRRSERAATGQSVVERGFAGIGQPDETEPFHEGTEATEVRRTATRATAGRGSVGVGLELERGPARSGPSTRPMSRTRATLPTRSQRIHRC